PARFQCWRRARTARAARLAFARPAQPVPAQMGSTPCRSAKALPRVPDPSAQAGLVLVPRVAPLVARSWPAVQERVQWERIPIRLRAAAAPVPVEARVPVRAGKRQ